ncbi:MAG: Gfo/Idh/MocA family oxidoreductase [Planctomycetota bacterium]
MKLRVGLIGLGQQWQSMHRPALKMLGERFDVRAIYADVAKLAENAVIEFQADPVDGYQAMVHRDDIDAILILEPSWLKFLPAMAACQAGKAVYWGGDLDLDPQADGAFKRCVEDSGVAFMAGLPRRYAPATLRLKELIATHLGPPRLIFCHRRLDLESQSQPRRPSGRSQVMSGANGKRFQDPVRVMRTELVELIDWSCYIVGDRPSHVSAMNLGSVDGESSNEIMLDYESLTMRFNRADESSSVTAQISCGAYIPSRWQEAIGFRPPAAMQVCCERGVAFIDLPGTLVWFDDAGRHQESLESESPIGEKMLGQFHRAVTSLVRNLCGLDDAYAAATILNAARQSDREGRRICLADRAI